MVLVPQVAGNAPRVNMHVRHEADPYLAFIDISEGSLDFGLSTSEKVRVVKCSLYLSRQSALASVGRWPLRPHRVFALPTRRLWLC